jgi:hypothetical protein
MMQMKRNTLAFLAIVIVFPAALQAGVVKALPQEMTKEQIEELHARLVEKKKLFAQELLLAEAAHKEAKAKFKTTSDDLHDEIFEALLDSHDSKSHKSIPKDVIRNLREVKAAEKKVHSTRQKLQKLDKEVMEAFGDSKCLDVSHRARKPVECTRIILP